MVDWDDATLVSMATALPRRFKLVRTVDVSGISGTGIVAFGIVFPDGHVAMRWNTGIASTVVYDSIEHVEHIHGHGGNTVIRFID